MASENESDSVRAANFAAARAIIDAPDVWALVVEAMTRRGFAGDGRHVELLYAIFTSRLLARPMCAFLKAPSSSGKSWLLNRTLELFPPESYEIKSGFSPKAIAYGRSDLRHRILAVQEASGLNGREGNMLVRTLISEGLVRWEVAGRQKGGFTTREVVRPGPIAFVLTTTHDALHGEDETRALSIQVEDSQAHTKEVIRNLSRRFAGGLEPNAVDLAPWHAYQRWLDAGPRAVVVPYAEAVGALFSVRANRSKRDYEQVMTAIAVSALLHQTRRDRDDAGRVMASLDDYAHARRFLEKPLNEASGSAIPAGVRETVAQLLDQSGLVDPYEPGKPPGLTMEQLATRLSVDKSVACRRVAKAKELGLVLDLGGGTGRPSRLVVVQPLPADWDVLPAPEYVETEMRGEMGRHVKKECEEMGVEPADAEAAPMAAPIANTAAPEPAEILSAAIAPPAAEPARHASRDCPSPSRRYALALPLSLSRAGYRASAAGSATKRLDPRVSGGAYAPLRPGMTETQSRFAAYLSCNHAAMTAAIFKLFFSSIIMWPLPWMPRSAR